MKSGTWWSGGKSSSHDEILMSSSNVDEVFE